MSTIARLRWNDGIDIDDLFNLVYRIFDRPEFLISDCVLKYYTSGGLLCAAVRLPQKKFRLIGADVHTLRWSVIRKIEHFDDHLVDFSISRHEGPEDPYNCFKNDKIVRMAASVDSELHPAYAISNNDPSKLKMTIEKYHLYKLLFSELGCDSVDANSDGFDKGIYEGDPDPGFEGKLFRFAKKGRQILINPLEERRAMRSDEVDSWRVVLDSIE